MLPGIPFVIDFNHKPELTSPLDHKLVPPKINHKVESYMGRCRAKSTIITFLLSEMLLNRNVVNLLVGRLCGLDENLRWKCCSGDITLYSASWPKTEMLKNCTRNVVVIAIESRSSNPSLPQNMLGARQQKKTCFLDRVYVFEWIELAKCFPSFPYAQQCRCLRGTNILKIQSSQKRYSFQ